jgi:hypothetical protein
MSLTRDGLRVCVPRTKPRPARQAERRGIKFGINRYVQSNTTSLPQLFDQAAGAVNSTTRSRNDQTFPVGDPRGNFLPDCNLVMTTANGIANRRQAGLPDTVARPAL